MSEKISILDPRSSKPLLESGRELPQVSPHGWPSLHGLRVGVIDNSKPNMNVLAGAMVSGLRRDFGVSDVEYHTKRTATGPADESVYQKMARLAHLAIVGSGD